MKTTLTFIFSILFSGLIFSQTNVVINNLIPRLDTDGAIIDAHDGRISKFGNKFYWYGTAYGNNSGFTRSNFFQCYSSPDLRNWKKEGELLVNKPIGTYYRPHVIYNAKTKKYVLWYNWYPKLWDGKYGVAVSDKPTGPFKIVSTDVKVLNSKYGVGDFGLFVDDDNTAYISYNTIDGHKGSIEKLKNDYLSSTMENSGFITEGCEAGAIFKKNNVYYMLTDYTCCFCTQGSGVRVYVSNNPMNEYKFKNNINRYPGTPLTTLIDDVLNPNVYSIIKKQDNSFSPIQINFSKDNQLNSLKIYQFTGNRYMCCDTTTEKCKADIVLPEFELFAKQNGGWVKIQIKTQVEATSVYNIIDLKFEIIASKSLLLKVSNNYPYEELFINKIKMYDGEKQLSAKNNDAMSFINDIDPMIARPIIPSQQTFVMPLKTNKGIEYVWMGDLWGSASDNIKGHDYQYWGSPLVFDDNGDIETMKWVDEWEITIVE
jgi:hypothetical protein